MECLVNKKSRWKGCACKFLIRRKALTRKLVSSSQRTAQKLRLLLQAKRKWLWQECQRI